MVSMKVNRRRFVAGTAAASAALVAAPFVRSANAAGKLSVGFWDHWVPGANKAVEALVKEWADKNKVEVSMDFITSQGNKLLLTTAAESQAKSGHDVLAFSTWLPSRYADQLVPMNEVMEPLIKENGAVNGTVEYLGKVNGKWLAVPATSGSQIKGPCSRIDLLKKHAGIDIQAMYPAGQAPKADAWTLDNFLKAAEACQKGGNPFGIGLGATSDSVDSAGALFHAFGAQLVNAKGDIVVKNDQVRQVLDYYKKLMQFLPPDVPSWDDASNNKFLVSGQGTLIMNPPSAWAVAKRDAPQVAEQLWTHGFPMGPKGRYAPFLPYFWGIWNFSKNQSAAKSLITFLSQASAAEKMTNASQGYDLPAFEKLTTFKVWAEESPPKGTLYHYPNPHNHQTLSIAAAPAPHKIAEQIYTQAIMTQMVVRYAKGEAMDKTLDWAAKELEGFTRN
ncbi:extracellular solute-binding protein [Reyranella sp.]|jgi:ABC-type glycerol-3-phosphate transport system substrate-binding protein|uniref:ABC transporter substrate-binding protein n=1 Tax=Reyranella sp. TaxID=1929291 RepID=UPI000BD758B4|nr:extracellular solute-binding protein [Reyranella sp.]OYY40918.1 MAG: ABC transporter substrate-binding protein [Rhodospirillales bacterium 35-66-84]OYZ95888.1 MAG: ABC transporter substrate-binding protein [Rhodospirillales bacterium 24-66-33]OZB25769.1 MAG: ABC transporter substrate-binding protein [Rhodospirillales bacterium 39-66-50]HQS14693.1 extracellular solute-binding protein [Reyranella sp.]HQT12393.1 extracellular solute-binding protein [Reyranella sp.]